MSFSAACEVVPFHRLVDTREAVPFHRLVDTREAMPIHRKTMRAFTIAALCYLGAQFVVSLGFMPWPYSSLQSTTLIAFVLAVAMRGSDKCNYQPYPSLLPR